MMEGKVEVVELIRMVVQWGVIPLIGFVWLIHKNQQNHNTEIAVLKALHAANKESHDREFKEVKDSFKVVLSKLEGIEEYLRK
jgi:hypothetical protein